ncbi:uncharacterized protein LOC108917891 [Anoplophora glabripennis]|uniref:uncharacterized protein LOC108917891 n=1 Tax=Anoplophora glabripennis TaxID=217634 RepID=UPI00087490E6|nr:uncharacterized protein LOC108917891 [Anoplophora glabripennis]
MSDVDMFEPQEYNAGKPINLEDSDVPGTSTITTKEKLCETKNKVEDKIILDQNYDSDCQIQMTKSGTFGYNNPFVYHHLEEVLRYSLECFPKNNNIHLIGVHLFSSSKGHYLQKHSDDKVVFPLDFYVADSIPEENELISVFGFLELKNSVPIFIVKFFRREVKIVANKYIQMLLEMRKYVPSDYLSTVSNSTIE